MKTFLSSSIIFLLFTGFACATEQVSDVVIIRGKRVHTHDMPSLQTAFPKLRIPEFRMISTANYKGYNATWAVIEGQLYLVGVEGFVKESGEMLWDEKILIGQEFPLKVNEWSGTVTQSSPVASFDPNTGKSGTYDEVTTIVFVGGRVSSVDFNRKVPRSEKPHKRSK